MLEWNVYYQDINRRKIMRHNVFDHSGFREDLAKAVKKYKEREEFEKEVRSSLMYWYWSKCEWEIILSGWPPSKDGEEEIKIDVFEQIMLNRQRFMDYLWENKKEIKQFEDN